MKRKQSTGLRSAATSRVLLMTVGVLCCYPKHKSQAFVPSARTAFSTKRSSNHSHFTGLLTGKEVEQFGFSWRFKGSDGRPIGSGPLKRSSKSFCYLLTSNNPKYPGKTYIGVTVDPTRRLDEHNRVRKGGAKRTAAARPWEYKLLVTGFPEYNAALRFEYAWQHFDTYRAVRKAIGDKAARRMKRDRGVKGQLAMLKALLIACPHVYGMAG